MEEDTLQKEIASLNYVSASMIMLQIVSSVDRASDAIRMLTLFGHVEDSAQIYTLDALRQCVRDIIDRTQDVQTLRTMLSQYVQVCIPNRRETVLLMIEDKKKMFLPVGTGQDPPCALPLHGILAESFEQHSSPPSLLTTTSVLPTNTTLTVSPHVVVTAAMKDENTTMSTKAHDLSKVYNEIIGVCNKFGVKIKKEQIPNILPFVKKCVVCKVPIAQTNKSNRCRDHSTFDVVYRGITYTGTYCCNTRQVHVEIEDDTLREELLKIYTRRCKKTVSEKTIHLPLSRCETTK